MLKMQNNLVPNSSFPCNKKVKNIYLLEIAMEIRLWEI